MKKLNFVMALSVAFASVTLFAQPSWLPYEIESLPKKEFSPNTGVPQPTPPIKKYVGAMNLEFTEENQKNSRYDVDKGMAEISVNVWGSNGCELFQGGFINPQQSSRGAYEHTILVSVAPPKTACTRALKMTKGYLRVHGLDQGVSMIVLMGRGSTKLYLKVQDDGSIFEVPGPRRIPPAQGTYLDDYF